MKLSIQLHNTKLAERAFTNFLKEIKYSVIYDFIYNAKCDQGQTTSM